MEKALTQNINKVSENMSIEDFLELSGIKEVADALEWLSRDKRFSMGENGQTDERVWVHSPLDIDVTPETISSNNKEIGKISAFIYYVRGINGSNAELTHNVRISYDPKAAYNECFIISHDVETKKAAQVGKAGYKKEICDPIPFGWDDINKMGETLESIMREYVLREDDIPLFETKLYSNLADPAIYMDENGNSTHAYFLGRLGYN